MNQQDSHQVPLPHPVYKVDFHENQILSHNVWSGIGPNDILKNIIDQTKNGAPVAQKNDSKVIIVLKLPVEGQVSGYNVGEPINVEILKHCLVLNLKVLLLSGIQDGILDIITDGPLTACGGICLNEYSKALKHYHSNLKKSNNSAKKNENKMTVSFKLPKFVDWDKLKHYNNCFEKSVDNPLQYSISYFEFDVKDPNEEKKEDKFKKVSSMFFSDN